MSIRTAASRLFLLPRRPANVAAPTVAELKAAAEVTVMLTQPDPDPEPPREPETRPEPVPALLPPTYSVHARPPHGARLCLATRWEPGDPMPMVCARAEHGDRGLHVTAATGGHGPSAQTTWTDTEEA